MKKSIICVLLLTILQNVFCNIVFGEDEREYFAVDVGMLNQKQLKNIQRSFKKIDLKPYATRDIKDEVAGDGTGGWSDQGDNDLRMFDEFGDREMLGIPFEFIDPATNNNKAVLALRGQNDMELPTSVDIPIDSTTAGAYFIHASPWCSGTCGTYSWVYSDGTEASVDIVQNQYICDFWGYNSYDFCRPAWTTTKSDGSQRSLYLFAMNNPYPEKKVKSLRLTSSGSGAYIMIMAITLTDSGPYLEQVESAKFRTTNTFGWYEYSPADSEKRQGSALDFSDLLDAPAGKHGALGRNGSNLVFEDGTAAKFYGVDIIGNANFPDKSSAANIAKEIAMDGVNLVRMRKIDGIIFGNNETHASFDKNMVDKLMFFISELKKNGVYVYLSLISDYRLFASDGIDNYEDYRAGLGFDGFWNEDLIRLQKEYVNMLMNTNNSYTGLTLLNDPAVAMVEFADSKSTLDFSTGKDSAANMEAQEKLNKMYNDFIKSRYITTASLNSKWNEYDKTPIETIEDGNLRADFAWRSVLHSDTYKKDMTDFLTNIEKKYYNEMKAVVPNKLSTVNTNPVNDYKFADVKVTSSTDFTARNSVHAKIMSVSDKISKNTVFNIYTSPTADMQNSTIHDLSLNAISNQPFICGYGAGMPNLYVSAESVMVPSFAAQNNWIPIQYSYANDEYQNSMISDTYAIYENPVKKALLPAIAMLYYSMNPIEETKKVVSLDTIDNIPISCKTLYTNNTRFSFEGNGNETDKVDYDTKKIQTDKIFWDSTEGIFEARSPKAEAMSGFFTQSEEMPSFILSADNTFVTAVLAAKDGKDIKNSSNLIFTVLCGAQNKGNSVNIVKDSYIDIGKAPILVETITGKMTLKIKGNFSVWALNANGERQSKIAVTENKNGYPEFLLTADNKTIQYEICRE